MKKILLLTLITITSYAQTIIINEDFEEASTPSNWFQNNIGGAEQLWTFGSNIVPGSVENFTTNAAIFNDEIAGNGPSSRVWLYHNDVDVSNYDQITLRYDYAFNGHGSGETLIVGVFNNTTNTWIHVKTHEDDTDPTTDFIDISAVINIYPEINPEQLYIGFLYDDNNHWSFGAGIDNVVLTGYNNHIENDFIFRHTTNTENIDDNITIINHPDLNGNPAAKIIASHNFNPSGTEGVSNNNEDGVYYNYNIDRWVIYIEDGSVNMSENIGASFNIYVGGNDSNVITHITTSETTTLSPTATFINNPLINGDSDAVLVIDNYLNPFHVFNNDNYGLVYDDDGLNWHIYNEGANIIPTHAAFNIIIEPSNNNTMAFKHLTNASNIENDFTIIDHPLLNEKPNAVFVFSHNWGELGSGFLLDSVLTAYYNGSNWTIRTEDFSPMPENAIFNIVVSTLEVASVNSNKLIDFNIYPNPVTNVFYINSTEILTNISILNLLGQEIKSFKPNSTNYNVDLTDLKTGVYFVKVITNNNKQSSKKFIKK